MKAASARKLISNAPSMLSGESDSESSSSFFQYSETGQSEKHELVIPSPVLMDDGKHDGVSLSQHKMAMAKQMANNFVVLNSTSGSDEDVPPRHWPQGERHSAASRTTNQDRT
jgi:hypothetical protein